MVQRRGALEAVHEIAGRGAQGEVLEALEENPGEQTKSAKSLVGRHSRFLVLAAKLARGQSQLSEGEAKMKRRDGKVVVVQPEKLGKSALVVNGINLKIDRDEILELILNGRRKAKKSSG